MKDAREFTDDDVYEFAKEWCEESLQTGFDEFNVDDMKQAYIAGCMKILSHVHELFMPRSGA